MSEQIIEAGYIYEHSEHGEVLVGTITKYYDSFDVTAVSGSNESEPIVHFHKQFDGYGGMFSPISEDVYTFADNVSCLREHDAINLEEMRES